MIYFQHLTHTYALHMPIYAHLISNAPIPFSLVITQQILTHMDPFIATEERFMTLLEGHIKQVYSR